jgi:hypothetical protein
MFRSSRSIFIEKGRPAEGEAGKGEISGSIVHATNPPPPPPLTSQLTDKSEAWLLPSPPTLLSLHTCI